MTKSIVQRPDPNQIYLMQPYDELLLQKNIIKADNIHIGDYTYLNDRRHGPEIFEEYYVLYNYDFLKVKLVK